jgi:hypothetical protein
MNYIFSLAPMSPTIKILTIMLWVLPFGIFLFSPEKKGTGIICLLILLLYVSIWIWWRPTYFRIASESLKIVFPGRKITIPREDIQLIRSISQQTFTDEFGWAIRIGVGGLWGGFGWLWTEKKGLIEFYVSRVDGLVVIERIQGKTLLITPEKPREFIANAQTELL